MATYNRQHRMRKDQRRPSEDQKHRAQMKVVSILMVNKLAAVTQVIQWVSGVAVW